MSSHKSELHDRGAPESDSKPGLPNPDLNPMVNPTLGRNLGKWAQVYFTSPPEKREEAVVELLRELETEPPDGPNPPPAEPEPVRDAGLRFSLRQDPESLPYPIPPDRNPLNCPRCLSVNMPDQLFCGICGTSLKDAGQYQTTAQVPYPDSLQWLRDKNLSSRDGYRRRRSLAPTLLLGLILAVAVVVAWPWRGQYQLPWSLTTGKTASSPVPVRSLPPAVTEPSPARQPTEPGPAQKADPLLDRRAAVQHAGKLTEPSSPSALRGSQASQETPAASRLGAAAASPDNSSSGNEDLSVAEKYLNRQYGSRNSAEAAKWLWKSVSKHNTAAMLLLADLYQRGDGVTRNCDQAQVLLVAAAKRGSAAAAEALRSLQSSGCR